MGRWQRCILLPADTSLHPRRGQPPAPAPRSLYNNIKAPSQLQASATYYLFKDGIEPKWEDPKNANGGCWTANVLKTPNAKQTLDAWWLHAVSGHPISFWQASKCRRCMRAAAAAACL